MISAIDISFQPAAKVVRQMKCLASGMVLVSGLGSVWHFNSRVVMSPMLMRI